VTLLPLALMLSLGVAPPGVPCEGHRVAMLPFDSLALARPEARRTEEAVRRALASTSGVCLEPRQQTVERLRALGGKPAPCADAACRAAEVKSLGSEWLVRGRVLGLGGERTVALVLVGSDGQEARSTFSVPDLETLAEDAAARAISALWGERQPRRAAAQQTLRPWPQVLMGAGAAALVAGAGFGLAARSTERRLSEGTAGCEGEGEAFRRCFADGLQRGRRQSLVANGLLGAGVVLGTGGVLLFVWELP
jgi:hypothetical protein